jgi:hypothetical protein
VSITNSGTAVFTGEVKGSSFTSTNFVSGTGVGITSAAGIDSIDFKVGGTLASGLTATAGGLTITSYGVTSGVATGTSITMTSAGAISIASYSNTISLGATASLISGSGGGTSGFDGLLRNTWAGLAPPSGGSTGDVWLTYT